MSWNVTIKKRQSPRLILDAISTYCTVFIGTTDYWDSVRVQYIVPFIHWEAKSWLFRAIAPLNQGEEVSPITSWQYFIKSIDFKFKFKSIFDFLKDFPLSPIIGNQWAGAFPFFACYFLFRKMSSKIPDYFLTLHLLDEKRSHPPSFIEIVPLKQDNLFVLYH